MTREEALMGMTIWPAHAAFMERESGSLSPGKYADFVVLDQDIMTCAPEAIPDTRVLATVIGGRMVHQEFMEDEPLYPEAPETSSEEPFDEQDTT